MIELVSWIYISNGQLFLLEALNQSRMSDNLGTVKEEEIIFSVKKASQLNIFDGICPKTSHESLVFRVTMSFFFIRLETV